MKAKYEDYTADLLKLARQSKCVAFANTQLTDDEIEEAFSKFDAMINDFIGKYAIDYESVRSMAIHVAETCKI